MSRIFGCLWLYLSLVSCSRIIFACSLFAILLRGCVFVMLFVAVVRLLQFQENMLSSSCIVLPVSPVCSRYCVRFIHTGLFSFRVFSASVAAFSSLVVSCLASYSSCLCSRSSSLLSYCCLSSVPGIGRFVMRVGGWF